MNEKILEIIDFFISRLLPSLDTAEFLIRSDRTTKAQANLLAALDRRCISISRGTARLLASGDVDNAQILIRSVIEGSAKFIFILDPGQHSGLNNGERLQEYSEVLYAISYVTDYEDSERFKAHMLTHLKSKEIIDRLFKGLDFDTYKKAKSLDKTIKSAAAKRWRPIEVLQRSMHFNPELFAELVHAYMLSCHQAHVSCASLQMFSDEFSLSGRESIEAIDARVLGYISMLGRLAELRWTFSFAVRSEQIPPRLLECTQLENMINECALSMPMTEKIKQIFGDKAGLLGQ